MYEKVKAASSTRCFFSTRASSTPVSTSSVQAEAAANAAHHFSKN